MKVPFLSQLQPLVGVDIGTTRVRIWSKQKGILVDEPNCIAYDKRVGKVIAVGQDAYEMVGRVSKNISVIFPFQSGVISSEEAVSAMLKVFFQRIFTSLTFLQPIVGVSLSSVSGQPERDSLVRSLTDIGAREVYVIDQVLAAAVGSGVPIADASGSFVLHMGGGVTEGGMIALGSLVEVRAITQAGEYLDQEILHKVQKEKQIIISLKQAELIKKQIGRLENLHESQILISGRDRASGVPKEVYVDSELISSVIVDFCLRTVELMKEVFTKIPPELTSDILDKGIICTGGLANLHGLESFFTQKLGVPLFVVDDPQNTVIKGIAAILENLDLFKQSLAYQG